MRYFVWLLVVILLVGCSTQEDTALELDLALEESMEISVLYDYVAMEEGLHIGDGFSMLIEWGDRNILFDTPYKDKLDKNGLSGFEKNIDNMDVELSDIDLLFLSHDHSKNGLSAVLKENSQMTLCSLEDINIEYLKRTYNLEPLIADGFTEIEDGIWTTGAMEGYAYEVMVYEQLMILETSKGLIVFSGCAHPGIEDMIAVINEHFPDEPILMMLGGFHLKMDKDDQVFKYWLDFMKEHGVERILPIHCSGDEFKAYAKSYEGIESYDGGVGLTILLK